MTDKYKPFDLQKALAGANFKVRECPHRELYDWAYLKKSKKISCIFTEPYETSGMIHRFYDENGIDLSWNETLVMLPKTKKLWIAINKDNNRTRVGAAFGYDSKEILEKYFDERDNYIMEVEIEE